MKKGYTSSGDCGMESTGILLRYLFLHMFKAFYKKFVSINNLFIITNHLKMKRLKDFSSIMYWY